MDFSDSYISMCNKAKKIQKGKPQNGVSGTWIANYIILSHTKESGHGDYYHVVDKEGIRRCDACGDEETYIVSTKSVWLPKQDQLQEMVYNPININAASAMFEEVSEFGNTFLLKSPQRTPQSAEQLWLCFIMSQKFSKQWNGKDWIKS